MDSLVDYKLDKDIFSNDEQYFFTLLSTRFELVNDRLAKLLERKYDKKFKPIYILSAPYNKFFQKENYIILNKKLKELKKKLKINNLIFLQEYEELNEEFSESGFIGEIIKNLAKKQENIFFISFTSSFLKLNHPKLFLLGPDPMIATKYDNKIEQIKLFKDLDLPRNETKIYENIELIRKDIDRLLPFFISSAYTSGGHESATIHTLEELNAFYNTIREINKSQKFLVAKLIKNIKLSPNTNAIVFGENKTEIIAITDQILRSNAYLGNIYPSRVNLRNRQIIIETTKKIGNFLSKLGYRGLFGCDFLIDGKGNCFVIDLNPRRQGGYLVNYLMSKKIDVLELELKLYLNQKLPSFNYDDFQSNFVWAHSKLKSHHRFQEIIGELKENEEVTPFRSIGGGEFKATFFPKGFLFEGGNMGYYIVSGKNYEDILRKAKEIPEILLIQNLE